MVRIHMDFLFAGVDGTFDALKEDATRMLQQHAPVSRAESCSGVPPRGDRGGRTSSSSPIKSASSTSARHCAQVSTRDTGRRVP